MYINVIYALGQYIPYSSKFPSSKNCLLNILLTKILNKGCVCMLTMLAHVVLLCFIMSLYQYFKPADVLPSPVGPLSKKIQSSSIAAANKHVREVKSAT